MLQKLLHKQGKKGIHSKIHIVWGKIRFFLFHGYSFFLSSSGIIILHVSQKINYLNLDIINEEWVKEKDFR